MNASPWLLLHPMRLPFGLVVMCGVVSLTGCRREPRPEPIDADGRSAALAVVPKDVAKPVEKAARLPVEVPELRIRPDGSTLVKVAWSAPEGTTVNDEAPFRVRWNRSEGLAEPPPDVRAEGRAAKSGFQATVAPVAGAPNATLTGEIDLVVCDAVTHATCLPVKRSLELGFIVKKDAPAEAEVTVPLPAARL